MNESPDANLLVYREGRQRVSGGELVRQLRCCLADLAARSSDAAISALLRAGELECALSDGGIPEEALVGGVTDRIAEFACALHRGESQTFDWVSRAVEDLDSIGSQRELTISRPEGFAYYALHPLDFADLAARTSVAPSAAMVVGIRSIGTTLSAVVSAQLRRMGARVERITVRPTGRPYQRCCSFNPKQQRSIGLALQRGADFLVCDEGPGRSGSSFLSVGEALERAGVRRERITLLCSHHPDIESLCAPDAPARWRRYQSVASGMTTRLPSDAGEYLGGGEWRRILLPTSGLLAPHDWPAAWPQMERLKYLSRDGRRVWKFQGHGHYGESVHQREQLLSDSGFGVPYAGRDLGFGAHERIAGREATLREAGSPLLHRLAEYCAWRARTMAASVSPRDRAELESMVAGNLEAEFGWSPELKLEVVCPVICDNRMQPSKWRMSAEGRWLKLDGSMHGDDHFFPGPTDIAWDLAGVCIEWKLGPAARFSFLGAYSRIAGEDPTARLSDYQLAYTTFRRAWSKMAAASTQGTDDAPRLWREYLRYRAAAEESLQARRLTTTLAA